MLQIQMYSIFLRLATLILAFMNVVSLDINLIHLDTSFMEGFLGQSYGREAVEFAVRMVNNRADILNNHNVVIHYADVNGVSIVSTLFI